VVDRDSLTLTGDVQVLALPAPDPHELLEPDPGAAVHDLMRMPFGEVCAFVGAVGEALSAPNAGVAAAGDLLAATSQVGDRAHRAFLAQLPELFDGQTVRAMVDRELGAGGTASLDAWVPVDERLVTGVTARMATRTPSLRAVAEPAAGASGGRLDRPLLRALPTTQLHLTAGNAPVVPVISLLWGWSTKGACVVKPASESAAVVAALAGALQAADAGHHPLARHTTLAYWRGGEEHVEDVLLAEGAFDRRVVWGSSEALASLTRRGGPTDTILLRPRHAVSLVGRDALRADLPGTVRRAAVDSLVANQQACMSSLLHVVEGDDGEADAYATELARVLARWDEALPHRPSRAAQSRLLALRRGPLASARWYVNGSWPEVTSAVARIGGAFDLSRHPGSRLVLVRATADLRAALDAVGPAVANVGVAPESARVALRDELAALGVDNVLPLGDAERGYAGRPHDGMRVLNRLIRWVNA